MEPNLSARQKMTEPNCVFLSSLKDCVHRISVKMLKDISQNQEVEVKDLPDSGSHSPSYIAKTISVIAKEVDVHFVAHVSQETVYGLASSGLGCPPEEVTEEMAQDLIGEFCNLTAGLIKATLQWCEGIEEGVVISLPQDVPDTSVAPEIKGEMQVHDGWILPVNDQLVYCSVYVDMVDYKQIETLGEVVLPPPPVFSEGGILLL
jgi:CheY-specific phosphatase CheX